MIGFTVCQTDRQSAKPLRACTKWAGFGKTCGQVRCKVWVFHGRQAVLQVVPNRGTAGARYHTQGLKKSKLLIQKDKTKLSTAAAALYYYDHVFIKEKRDTKEQQSGPGAAGKRGARDFGFSEGLQKSRVLQNKRLRGDKRLLGIQANGIER